MSSPIIRTSRACPFVLSLICLLSVVSIAQDKKADQPKAPLETVTGDPQATKWAEKEADSKDAEPKESGKSDDMPSLMTLNPALIPVSDYTGDIWNRQAMTGDWWELRTDLLRRGITFDVQMTQVFQDITHGGENPRGGFRYSGSVDYYLNLDTARMGLWPGGLWTCHLETQFGHGINRNVGSLMPVNFDALLPVPNDPGITTLSSVSLTQALSEHLVVMVGKLDPLILADNNVFANSEKTQFLNTGLRKNPLLFPYAPYTLLGALVSFMPTGKDDLVINAVAGDTYGTATRAGFNSWFHGPEGTSVAGEIDLKVRPFDLPGNVRFGGVWTSRTFLGLPEDRRTIVTHLRTGAPIERREINDPYAFYVNFDQYLFLEDEKTWQGIGVFGRGGWGPSDGNLVSAFYSIGIGGKGIIPGRDNDTFGIGYYYAEISPELTTRRDRRPLLPPLIRQRLGLEPPLGRKGEHGIEMYYDIEVTPWLHITPDLQLIADPSGVGRRANYADPNLAVVAGFRLQMSF